MNLEIFVQAMWMETSGYRDFHHLWNDIGKWL